MEKLPPIEKVFEAWTAIADNRVVLGEHSAKVVSSDGAKEYTIQFDDRRYASNDNATYWQGYAGYPILAVLMLQGKLPFDREQAELWRNVNWKDINSHYKNNYAKAVEEIAMERKIDLNNSYIAVEGVIEALKQLGIEIKRKL